MDEQQLVNGNDTVIEQCASEQDVLDRDVIVALDAAPFNVELHRAVAVVHRRQGHVLEALAHVAAADVLTAVGHDTASAAPAVCQLATGFFMKQDYPVALWWYQLVLLLDPNHAVAYLNLVVIYLHSGRIAEAEQCRERAYQLQRIFINSASNMLSVSSDPQRHPRQLLILCVGRSAGNIPYEVLLSGGCSDRITYIIDYAAVAEDVHLPKFDMVFNAIGDADVAAPLSMRLAAFEQSCRVPVLNAPARVAATGRNNLMRLVEGVAGVVVAPCVLLTGGGSVAERELLLERVLAQPDMLFPLLIRPVASHGGQGLVCCADSDELRAYLQIFLREGEGAFYLTRFINTADAHGFYRKYRVIYIDRQPYPYHMAITTEWMVHYISAKMEEDDWKIEEERAFLQDPAATLGAQAIAALMAIGNCMDLDYVGIDFTLLADGRILIFEANATMLVHRVRANGVLAYKNAYVEHIVAAFEQMLIKHESTHL